MRGCTHAPQHDSSTLIAPSWHQNGSKLQNLVVAAEGTKTSTPYNLHHRLLLIITIWWVTRPSPIAYLFPLLSSRNSSTMAYPHPHRRMSSIHKETKPNEKHPQFGLLPLSTSGPQDCALTGVAVLNTPYFNKGAAFPANERKQFKLAGLLPQNVQSLDQQVKRAYQQFATRQDSLAKNTFMTSLAEQNQVLYFRVSGIYYVVHFSLFCLRYNL